MTDSHWAGYHASWARLAPPLRPHPAVVARMRELIADRAGPTLLLGVTPELADIGPDLSAADWSEGMIRGVWPGDTRDRRAVVADWLALPFSDSMFRAVIGDGLLNALDHPTGQRSLHGELARVLAPGGRAVVRVFRRPDDCESLAAACEDAARGRPGTFHAFKWRFAMALATERRSASLPVTSIHAAFVECFPDRDTLASRTGWDRAAIDTIDVYRGSREVYSFPSEREILEAVPVTVLRPRLVEVEGYELSERCPLLVLDRAQLRSIVGPDDD